VVVPTLYSIFATASEGLWSKYETVKRLYFKPFDKVQTNSQ